MSVDADAAFHGPNVPLLVVLSGPSGVGKDAALDGLRGLGRPWHFVVTATTRPIRANEVDGADYIFLSDKEFERMVSVGEFLEHAYVYGNWYGVPKSQITGAIEKGLDTILKVDVQGAATFKRLLPDAVFIFLEPPSLEDLRRRLTTRATESGEALEARVKVAWNEMECMISFDYHVVNHENKLDEAVACIDSIILAEKCRTLPRKISI